MKEIAAQARALSEKALSLTWNKETPIDKNSQLEGLPLKTGDTGDGLLQLPMRKEVKVSPVNEADRGQPGTGLGTPAMQARRGGLQRHPHQRSGNELHDVIADSRASDPDREDHHTALLARADAMIAESEGRRPPLNQSVHAMFREARVRFGSRDLEERSITSWLRRHAPAVAVLWPEAPLDASWFAWRCHVGREHLDVLDSAWRASFQGGC